MHRRLQTQDQALMIYETPNHRDPKQGLHEFTHLITKIQIPKMTIILLELQKRKT